MKKLLLASAVAALSVMSAQAAPQIYGKAFLTLDVQDGDTKYTAIQTDPFGAETTVSGKRKTEDGRTQLNSNASRIGFKGSEALTANTDLVYQLEYRVEIDDDTRTFENRDSYLGLSNKQYGTLLAGRLTAIDSMVDYANVTVGGVIGGDNVLASVDGPRANNAFAYVSPNYNGVNFLGMYILDEKTDMESDYALGNSSNNGTDTLGRDAWGVGVQYEPENAPYRAGATHVQAGKLRATRVSGAFDVNPALTVGALYQNTKFGRNSKKENAFTVSADYKVAQTPWTAYGQVDIVDNAEGAKDAEKQRLVLGSKYAFNKATTAHVYGAYLKTKDLPFEDKWENAGAWTSEDIKNKFTGFGIGAGIEYKF